MACRKIMNEWTPRFSSHVLFLPLGVILILFCEERTCMVIMYSNMELPSSNEVKLYLRWKFLKSPWNVKTTITRKTVYKGTWYSSNQMKPNCSFLRRNIVRSVAKEVKKPCIFNVLYGKKKRNLPWSNHVRATYLHAQKEKKNCFGHSSTHPFVIKLLHLSKRTWKSGPQNAANNTMNIKFNAIFRRQRSQWLTSVLRLFKDHDESKRS